MIARFKENGMARYGLDFGFTNHPTILTECAFDPATDTIYVWYGRYLYHAFEEDIAKEIQSRGIGNEIVNADRAEDRAIAKIMNLGVPKIRPCWKSPNGWREVGIRFIAQHRCVIDARPHRAKDVRDEMSRYEHKRYKNGDLHSEYPKEGDDAADSVRYALEPDIRDWYKPKSWAPPTMRRRATDAI